MEEEITTIQSATHANKLVILQKIVLTNPNSLSLMEEVARVQNKRMKERLRHESHGQTINQWQMSLHSLTGETLHSPSLMEVRTIGISPQSKRT